MTRRRPTPRWSSIDRGRVVGNQGVAPERTSVLVGYGPAVETGARAKRKPRQGHRAARAASGGDRRREHAHHLDPAGAQARAQPRRRPHARHGHGSRRRHHPRRRARRGVGGRGRIHRARGRSSSAADGDASRDLTEEGPGRDAWPDHIAHQPDHERRTPHRPSRACARTRPPRWWRARSPRRT